MLKDFLGKIVQGNCLTLLPLFEEECIDLVITSPPYDDLRSYNGYSLNIEKMAIELYRVVKKGGVVVWVVGDATINGSETGTSFRQALTFMETGWNLHDTMIFQKKNPIPQIYRHRYTNEFEYMFVFSKGKVKTHNPLTTECLHAGLKLNGTTYKNYSKHEQRREKQAKPVNKTKIKGNIWTYVVGKKKEDQEAKKHPAPFPYQLAYDHILSWSNENDICLDPMCGSGTTCLAASNLNRKFVGIEVSVDYCQIAKNRLNLS